MKEFYKISDDIDGNVFESYDEAMEYIARHNPELDDDAMVNYAESHIESLSENDVEYWCCADCGRDMWLEKTEGGHRGLVMCNQCWGV